MKPVFFTMLVSAATPALAESVQDMISRIAVEEGVSPDLALAVAMVESGHNPNAVGKLGEIGVFQLRPEFHDVRLGMTEHNIRTGLKYLKTVQRLCSQYPGETWINCFNRGPYRKPLKRPNQFPYYIKVMAAK